MTAILTAGTGAAFATPAPASPRPIFAIHTVSRHVIAPATIRPGLVHVRNTGRHPILVLTARHSAGIPALVRDLSGNGKAGPAHLLRDFSLLDIVGPGRDVFLRMARGRYYLADATVQTYTKAKVTTTRVAGRCVNAATLHPKYVRVAPGGTITAPATVTRQRYLRVANRSSKLQEMLLLPVGKRITRARLDKFLAHPSFDGLFTIAPSIPVFVAVLTPGRVVTTRVSVRPGRHLLFSVSFSTTTNGTGLPTLNPGQVRLVRVSK